MGVGGQSVQGAVTPIAPLPSRGKGALLSGEAWYWGDQAQLRAQLRGRPEDHEGGKGHQLGDSVVSQAPCQPPPTPHPDSFL